MDTKLRPVELHQLHQCGNVRNYHKGDLVFAEGEPADNVYFIEQGQCSVFLHEFTNRVEIGQLGCGEFFGEMAVINQGKRTASVVAISDATLTVINRDAFLTLLNTDGHLSDTIKRIIARRTEELVLKENLLTTVGIKGNNLQISIKGDPSLRETAFMRERYESLVDKVLPELVAKLKILLLERCISEVFLQFNSGEIRLTSILDPFNYEIHPANKLIDDAYLDRHFPVLAYAEKARLIRRLYDTLAAEFSNVALPKNYKDVFQHHYQSWQPLAQDEIAKVIDKLPVLRSIPDFYLRNMGISMTRDAIRMQFNCDGTHIIGTQDYSRFLADNIGLQGAA
ncbi:MAG: cyclic nucleotide-binding domain-containing protein [Pseudomonadota bacterium]